MKHDDELAEELVKLDLQIKALRKVRADATYDLEWALKEQARVRRHLSQNEREEKSA